MAKYYRTKTRAFRQARVTEGAGLYIDGYKEFQKALRKAPDTVKKEVLAGSVALAKELAQEAKQKVRSGPGVASKVAKTLRHRRGRQPQISFGGKAQILTSRGRKAKKARTVEAGGLLAKAKVSALTRWRQPPRADDLIWGVEFGGKEKKQFEEWTDKGYFIFPTIERNRKEIARRYLDIIEKAWESMPNPQ